MVQAVKIRIRLGYQQSHGKYLMEEPVWLQRHDLPGSQYYMQYIAKLLNLFHIFCHNCYLKLVHIQTYKLSI